jgi:hypothetical protein
VQGAILASVSIALKRYYSNRKVEVIIVSSHSDPAGMQKLLNFFGRKTNRVSLQPIGRHVDKGTVGQVNVMLSFQFQLGFQVHPLKSLKLMQRHFVHALMPKLRQ